MKTVYVVMWQFVHGRNKLWRSIDVGEGSNRFQSEDKAFIESLVTELQQHFSGHANYAIATIEIPS